MIIRHAIGFAVFLALGACASGPPAPIRTISVPSSPNQAATPTARPRFYVVQPNDTLSSIGKRFNLPYSRIAIWNEIADPSSVRPGQILRLEPGRPLVASAPKSAGLPKDSSLPGSSPVQRESPSADVEVKPVIMSGFPAGQEIAMPAPDSAPTLSGTSPQKLPDLTAPANPAAQLPAHPETPVKSSGWVWPAEGPLLARFDPGPGMRHGIDIGGKAGEPVRAARAGTVIYSGSGLRGYGRLIIIRHDKNYITAYAHNAQLLVKEGAKVKTGQVIARMGQSGNAGRVMLHFELREQGHPKDPLAYLPPRP